MDGESAARGITLIELVVVMALIAIISGVVGPSVATRLENLSLRTTAMQLAAQFRKAQAEAKIAQTPIAAAYDDGAFHFLRGSREIGRFPLPASVAPDFGNGSPMLMFFPSGQIAGPGLVRLSNPNGRRALIQLDFLNGITVAEAAR